MQEVLLLDELDVDAEEQSAQLVAAEDDSASGSAQSVREELEGGEQQEVEVGHAEERTQSEYSHAVY